SISSLPVTGAACCFTFSVILIPALRSMPAPTGGQTVQVMCTPLQTFPGFCDTDRGFHIRYPSDQTASLCRASQVPSRISVRYGAFPWSKSGHSCDTGGG